MSLHLGVNRVATATVFLVCAVAGATRAAAQTVHVSDDTNINLAMTSQVNGTATTLLVRNVGSGGERHTYLRFDMSTVPSGVLINQAKVRLFVLTVNDPGPVDVYAIGGAWNEETVSAATAPTLGVLLGSISFGLSDQNRYVLVDVTSAVQGWVNGSLPNYGIAVLPRPGSPVRVTLDSKEATGTSHGPELEVAVIPTGDITSVTAGLGLAGGGVIGGVSLSLDTLFTDARYAPLAHGHNVSAITGAATLGANTFTGNQAINGLGSFTSSASPGTVLRADSTSTGSNAVVAIRGTTLGSNSAAIVGEANSMTGFSTAVVGNAANGTGVGGWSGGTSGYGVRGQASGIGGVGVFGQGQNGTVGSGVLGISEATGGTGVDARATATTGLNYGLSALTFSTQGTGASLVAGASSGNTFGLQAFVSSAAGTGARFEVPAGAQLLRGLRTGGVNQSATETFRVDADGVVFAGDYRDLAGNPILAGLGDITAVAVGAGLVGGAASGAATLSLDTGYTDARYAAAVHGHNVSAITGAATVGANTLSGTQTIDLGNLDLDPSSPTTGLITKNGSLFLHNSGTNNTFLGVNAGNVVTTGGSNTGVGTQALSSTSGPNNTAIGAQALRQNAGGQGNTSAGAFSLQNNTTGSSNTATGLFALVDNTGGSGNTAIGAQALQFNTTGSVNTASGQGALQTNTSGANNTATGNAAMNRNTTGFQNTAIGDNALFFNTNGTLNVAVGRFAGGNATTGSNNIYLGANVAGVAGESNTIYVGALGTQTKTVIAGIRGTTVTGGEAVLIDATGRLGSGSVTVGADAIGSAQVIDDSLTAADLAPSSVTGSELAAASVTADKVAFNYAGSATPGGAAIDLVCLGCVNATEVSFAFAGPGANTFSGTQTIDSGNLDLDASTATAGNITKNGTRFLHGFGNRNTFVGPSAGNFFLTGGDNTASGYTALSALGAGIGNTAAGSAALQANTDGSQNTALGVTSLQSNSTGTNNTAGGASALNGNTTGDFNVALGAQAGSNATTGSNNIYVGANVVGVASESNTMYLGKQGTQTKTVIAGIRGTTVTGGEAVLIDANGRLGSGAVTIGADAVGSAQVIDDSLTAADLAPSAVTGSELAAASVTADKVAFNYAGSATPGGAAIDLACLGCVTATEVSFTFAGLGANTFAATQTIGSGNLDLPGPTTASSGSITKGGGVFLHSFGSFNTFVGPGAGNLTMTGGSNTGAGFQALFAVTSGTENTAVGTRTLANTTSGLGNTANGANVLLMNTTGNYNTGIGVNALTANNTGRFNTAAGGYALAANTGGLNNTATGYSALASNTTGSSNTASGLGALNSNTNGGSNTAIGAGALQLNTTGALNTATGFGALQSNLTGTNNTANGFQSLFFNTGSNNVAVGLFAGLNATTGSNNIYLGANVQGTAGESDTMYLGGTQTKSHIAGVRGVTTINPDAIPVVIDSAGQLGTVSSSRRFKEDIHDMADTSRRLFQLRPVTFRYTQPFGDGSKPLQYGLIAEEVAVVFPELAVRNADGEIETVQYQTLSVLLLNELQKFQHEARRQEENLRAHQRELRDQRERIERLEERLRDLLDEKGPGARRR